MINGIKFILDWFFSKRTRKKSTNIIEKMQGLRVAKNLVNGIYNETLKLKIQSRIGQEEEFLKNRKQEFRYLVYKNYKVIYWINERENRIEINDVFDTRQNPTKIKRTK